MQRTEEIVEKNPIQNSKELIKRLEEMKASNVEASDRVALAKQFATKIQDSYQLRDVLKTFKGEEKDCLDFAKFFIKKYANTESDAPRSSHSDPINRIENGGRLAWILGEIKEMTGCESKALLGLATVGAVIIENGDHLAQVLAILSDEDRLAFAKEHVAKIQKHEVKEVLKTFGKEEERVEFQTFFNESIANNPTADLPKPVGNNVKRSENISRPAERRISLYEGEDDDCDTLGGGDRDFSDNFEPKPKSRPKQEEIFNEISSSSTSSQNIPPANEPPETATEVVPEVLKNPPSLSSRICAEEYGNWMPYAKEHVKEIENIFQLEEVLHAFKNSKMLLDFLKFFLDLNNKQRNALKTDSSDTNAVACRIYDEVKEIVARKTTRYKLSDFHKLARACETPSSGSSLGSSASSFFAKFSNPSAASKANEMPAPAPTEQKQPFSLVAYDFLRNASDTAATQNFPGARKLLCKR